MISRPRGVGRIWMSAGGPLLSHRRLVGLGGRRSRGRSSHEGSVLLNTDESGFLIVLRREVLVSAYARKKHVEHVPLSPKARRDGGAVRVFGERGRYGSGGEGSRECVVERGRGPSTRNSRTCAVFRRAPLLRTKIFGQRTYSTHKTRRVRRPM